MAMSCRRHSQNTTPTLTGHNQTAQRAADSDQFCTAVARATTSTSVASLNKLINNSPDNITPEMTLPTILTTVSQWCLDALPSAHETTTATSHTHND
jgi:hypothetical protein